jgi:hypothetical protein
MGMNAVLNALKGINGEFELIRTTGAFDVVGALAFHWLAVTILTSLHSARLFRPV